ncbi:hypothetical protein Tcan_14362, partial [Toxocara canis]
FSTPFRGDSQEDPAKRDFVVTSMAHFACFLLLVVPFPNTVNARGDSLLGLFGLNTGNAGTVNRIPLDDITSQSFGLLSYVQSVQQNPDNDLQKKLLKPLPRITLLDGLPAVPGLMGSLPGVGGCLPSQIPLVNRRSLNFFQNFLRFIPGAQDYLISLVETPNTDAKTLLGKYHWVPFIFKKFVLCVKVLFDFKVKNLLEKGNTSLFSTADSFHEENAQGPAKVGFGYGILHNRKAYIYFQEDPCPYQIVMIGPVNAVVDQYEYIVLSNWAKYPIIAMARDVGEFNAKYREEIIGRFKKEGYIHDLSELTYLSVVTCSVAIRPLARLFIDMKELSGRGVLCKAIREASLLIEMKLRQQLLSGPKKGLTTAMPNATFLWAIFGPELHATKARCPFASVDCTDLLKESSAGC